MQYKLLLQNQDAGLSQTSWAIQPPSTLGREDDCQLFIDHESISRRHCQFHLNIDEALVIEDLSSLNGIYVDDRRVDRAVLMPGMTVQIGALTMTVEFSEESEQPARPAAKKPQSNPYETQPMDTFTPVPLREEKSWWQKLFS
ncbi:MAG: hypothetical protein Aurels2KO_32960 [Aureliella sp.]